MEIWVTQAMHAELMKTDDLERCGDKLGQSTGTYMRAMLQRNGLDRWTLDWIPNPLPLVIKQDLAVPARLHRLVCKPCLDSGSCHHPRLYRSCRYQFAPRCAP